MKISISTKSLTLSFLALLLLIAFWFIQNRSEASVFSGSKEIPRQTASKIPFKMKGLTYKSYEDGRLASKITADEIKISSRDFWIFNVKPFKEVVLENATIQVYLERNEQPDREIDLSEQDVDLFFFGNEILTVGRKFNGVSPDKGSVSRGVIKDLDLKIYQSDELSILVKSRKAYVDFRKKELKMKDVIMKDLSTGRIIKSRLVIWNNEIKAFEIAGRYIAKSQDGILNGKMIKIGLDFKISPLQHG